MINEIKVGTKDDNNKDKTSVLGSKSKSRAKGIMGAEAGSVSSKSNTVDNSTHNGSGLSSFCALMDEYGH